MSQGFKKCADCEKLKQTSKFHTDNQKSDKLCSYCKSCWAVRKKQVYESRKDRAYARHKIYRRIRRQAETANAALLRAVRSGRIIKTPCEICGTTKNVQGHHYLGYDKEHYLDVKWLCVWHHRKEENHVATI